MNEEAYVRTASERRIGKRYVWEFLAGVVLFVVLMFVPKLVTPEPWWEQDSPSALALRLLPMLGVVWMAIALIRHLARIDELQRTVLLQSFAIGFGVAMLIAITMMLVSPALVAPQGAPASTEAIVLPLTAVFIGGMSAWAISLFVLNARSNR